MCRRDQAKQRQEDQRPGQKRNRGFAGGEPKPRHLHWRRESARRGGEGRAEQRRVETPTPLGVSPRVGCRIHQQNEERHAGDAEREPADGIPVQRRRAAQRSPGVLLRQRPIQRQPRHETDHQNARMRAGQAHQQQNRTQPPRPPAPAGKQGTRRHGQQEPQRIVARHGAVLEQRVVAERQQPPLPLGKRRVAHDDEHRRDGDHPVRALHDGGVVREPRERQQKQMPERRMAFVSQVRKQAGDAVAVPREQPSLDLVRPHLVLAEQHRQQEGVRRRDRQREKRRLAVWANVARVWNGASPAARRRVYAALVGTRRARPPSTSPSSMYSAS